MPTPHTLLSNKQAAHYIGVSVPTLNRYRSEGTPFIPHHKVGGLVKYRQEDLDAYLASVRKGAACQGAKPVAKAAEPRHSMASGKALWRKRRMQWPFRGRD